MFWYLSSDSKRSDNGRQGGVEERAREQACKAVTTTNNFDFVNFNVTFYEFIINNISLFIFVPIQDKLNGPSTDLDLPHKGTKNPRHREP